MNRKRKPESIGAFIARELFGFGQDIVKAGFDLTVETPVNELRKRLSPEKKRRK